ncbi:hypothetical protein MTO96_008788 [Rhipicephalus appendiculatus]
MGEEARCARALGAAVRRSQRSVRSLSVRPHPLLAFHSSSSAGVAALRCARFVRGRRAPRPRSVDWQLDSAPLRAAASCAARGNGRRSLLSRRTRRRHAGVKG